MRWWSSSVHGCNEKLIVYAETATKKKVTETKLRNFAGAKKTYDCHYY